jgi:hypothetical protein
MRVLGLDPSLTAFGWAMHDTEARGKDRCIARGRFATSKETMFVDRYVFMRESLRALIREQDPDKVGIESPIFHNLFSEGMYGLFLYSNEALRLERRDVVFFAPEQGKAHAREAIRRPKGWKMLKGDMVEAAKADTGGRGVWNHNEADAYLIGKLAARFWAFLAGTLTEESLTPVERKQFALIHTFQRGKRAGQVEKRGLIYREEDRFFLWSEAPAESTHTPESEDAA